MAVLAVLVAGCAAQQPDPSPTPSPSATAAPAMVWAAADVPDSAIGSATLVVVPGGEGMVAIGFDGAFGSTVWTSAEGDAWTDVTPADFETSGLVAAIEVDDGLVAVGRDTADIETELAAAWRSTDGLAWRRVPGGDEMTGQLVDVVATDDGLVGIGGVPGADAAGIWTSTDGETWQRQPGGTFEHAFLWSIVEGGPGLVATGWRRNPEPDLAVWTSADGGVSWTLAPDPEGFEGFEGRDLLALEDGTLVMVGGSVFESEGRIWTSTDGVGWSVADVPGGLVGSSVVRLVDTSVGIVAVGSRGPDGAAWISGDGLSWEPFGDSVANAYFSSAYATDDGRLVVTGATQVETTDQGVVTHAAIWTTDLE